MTNRPGECACARRLAESRELLSILDFLGGIWIFRTLRETDAQLQALWGLSYSKLLRASGQPSAFCCLLSPPGPPPSPPLEFCTTPRFRRNARLPSPEAPATADSVTHHTARALRVRLRKLSRAWSRQWLPACRQLVLAGVPSLTRDEGFLSLQFP